MLRSAEAADREWEARTDRSRRPDYAREPATTASPEPLLPATPPATAPGDGDDCDPLDTMAPARDPVLADYQREAMRERARKLKRENDDRDGLIVPVAKAAREAFEFARAIRGNVFNVPPRLAAQLAAESDESRVYTMLDAALREALEATAAQLESLDYPELAIPTSPTLSAAIESGSADVCTSARPAVGGSSDA